MKSAILRKLLDPLFVRRRKRLFAAVCGAKANAQNMSGPSHE